MKHNLYTNQDKDIPSSILDCHEDVVLSLCKDCGQGECDLTEFCHGAFTSEFSKENLATLAKELNESYDSELFGFKVNALSESFTIIMVLGSFSIEVYPEEGDKIADLPVNVIIDAHNDIFGIFSTGSLINEIKQ